MAHHASAAARLWNRIRFEIGQRGVEGVILELQRDAMLPLPRCKEITLVCLDGALWVTEDDERRDVILEAGGRHRLTREGTAIVIALCPARLRVEAPEQGIIRGWSKDRSAARACA
jgi:hypothetical protein